MNSVFLKLFTVLLLLAVASTSISCSLAGSSSTITATSPGEVVYWEMLYPASFEPSQVKNVDAIAVVSGSRLDISISAIDYGIALKSDGTVYYWVAQGGGSQQDNAEASQVSGLKDITAISTGFGNSLALDSNGKVWSWGNNYYGQFGIGITGGGDHPQGTTTIPGTTPPLTIQQPVQVTNLNNVIAISSGLKHCLELKTDGTVWAWGDNEWGQLGDGTRTARYFPTQVKNLEGIVAISAGHYHSLALKSDGTVWSWGDNESGELGNGTTSNSYFPIQVKGLTKVTAIAAGEAHSLALRSDGTVWSWGNNENGQAGNGTHNTKENPAVATPVKVSILKNVIAISEGGIPGGGESIPGALVKYGAGYCLALESDGTVWRWGATVAYLEPWLQTFNSTPQEIDGLSSIIVISAGGYYATAIKNK
ncbi:MAG: hypothetical protein JW967_00875 [Dehalococcoidales bacterium]|nr:hypothetical protein [Dehalococcoidales bacterium]